MADKYSTDLVHYVRQVLEVIPQSVFQLLDRIIHLQTKQLKPVPTKMERKFLADYAQLDLRFALARFTHEISVFTQGILAIKATVMGIVPHQPQAAAGGRHPQGAGDKERHAASTTSCTSSSRAASPTSSSG